MACSAKPGAERGGRREEVRNLGPREPIQTLADEFKFNTLFGEKVNALRVQGYRGWRRVRGDGNCFYRSVGFALLEQCVAADVHDPQRAKWLSELRKRLQTVRLDEAYRASHDELLSCVERLLCGVAWQVLDADLSPLEVLYRSFIVQNTVDLALIRAVRHLVADHLVSNADSLGESGISYDVVCMAQGYDNVSDFCRKVVLPLGVEAEGIVLNGVPQALGIDLRVALLDRSGSGDVAFCDYSSSGSDTIVSPCAAREVPLVHVQLRPGHYDVLYFCNSGLCSDDHAESEHL
uniref:ubiquitinyl hydrolase 1 n=1 Tax=Noctiluca scintillans TaxID=2966 RepID=A0A7S1B1P2_NOCSC|mmetsp:Transcript_9159/g.25592  ORF Transcript_9159/g.25592 Transcript_9159/m.25592 type:complete len:292 (+) Transcript_9159:19-894(+)